MNSRHARLYRHRSRLRIQGTPVIAVMVGSLISALPIIAQSPVLPPVGLLVLIAWRLLCPDLWPVWIALPLGLFDDMLSGHLMGTALFLWPLALIAVDVLSARFFWRDWRYDWFIASLCILFVMIASWTFLDWAGGAGPIRAMIPMWTVSLLAFPLVVRICARLDRWRLP